MATVTQQAGLIVPFDDGPDLSGEFDRVLHTAGDRPNTDTLPALTDPTADFQDLTVARRRDDVEEKHRRICDFLDATGHDAVVLGRADSIAWFTSGGDLGQDLGGELGSVQLFINRTCRAVITDNVQSARAFEEELAGLGFQLKERAWHDDPGQIVGQLSRNKKIATDLCLESTPWTRKLDCLRSLRQPLTGLERQRMRELGRTLSAAVEATCRNFVKGEKEADIAGHLAHRLIREGVIPVDLRVAGDDRLERFRQSTFKSVPIEKRATITVTGRRFGLCASLSRTVSFGPVEPEYRAKHLVATMVDASCFYFSRPKEKVSEVFRRAKRIYEKFDHPHEWTLDYLGHVIGYAPREILITPDSPFVLRDDTALCWSPSVGAARSCDTVVIDSRGYEVVTAARNWPQIDVAVKGYVIHRPGILER